MPFTFFGNREVDIMPPPPGEQRWHRDTMIQLIILILIVPTQLLLTDWLGTPEFERSDIIRRFVISAQFYYDKCWVDVKEWRRALRVWVFSRALNVEGYEEPPASNGEDSGTAEDSAAKTIKSGDGLLGASLEVHSPRPIDVQYRVGQVIKHKIFNYRAVIIGWDERPKAPKGWFEGAVPDSELAKHVNQPFYSVLIDTRDRAPQTTYVPSSNIELLPHNRVIHPSVDDYFENFDGHGQYVMRPWLKRIYPHDGP